MSRPFGEIRQRDDRPGFRVRFTWRGATYERAAGSTEKAAEHGGLRCPHARHDLT